MSVRSELGRTIQMRLPQRYKRRLLFVRSHGRWGHFNRPRTFSEKVNWRILNDRRMELTWTCDKLATKSRASKAGIKTPRTLWEGVSISTLHDIALPDHWVLKPNHRSSLVYFGTGEPDIDHLQKLTSGWIEEPLSKQLGEWAYSYARRLLFVEEQLEPTGRLLEYKFFVMNGRAEIVQVDLDRFGIHRRNVYTRDWVPFDTQYQCPKGDDVPPPDRLAEMLSAAECVASDLDFLRVDLYYVNGEIYLGEVSPYPGSGLVRHRPYSSNLYLGSLWQLPEIKASNKPGRGSRESRSLKKTCLVLSIVGNRGGRNLNQNDPRIPRAGSLAEIP